MCWHHLSFYICVTCCDLDVTKRHIETVWGNNNGLSHVASKIKYKIKSGTSGFVCCCLLPTCYFLRLFTLVNWPGFEGCYFAAGKPLSPHPKCEQCCHGNRCREECCLEKSTPSKQSCIVTGSHGCWNPRGTVQIQRAATTGDFNYDIYPNTFSLSLSLSVHPSLSHTHTHTHRHAGSV